MKFNPEHLAKFSKSPRVQSAIKQITEFVNNDAAWQDVRHVAYLFATIQHETAGTFEPIKEYRAGIGSDGRANQDRYWKTNAYGRGYVQLTWADNYRKMSKRIGVPALATNFDLALQADTAYKIASTGMREGLFTGHDLDDHINGSKCDYRNARKIINRLDKAAKIAAMAVQWEARLRDASEAESGSKAEVISETSVTFPVAAEPEAGTEQKTVTEYSIDDLSQKVESANTTITTVSTIAGKATDSVKAFRAMISLKSFGAIIAAIGAFIQDKWLGIALIFVGILIIAAIGWKYMTRQEKIGVERVRKN
jgi:hypothetical protein